MGKVVILDDKMNSIDVRNKSSKCDAEFSLRDRPASPTTSTLRNQPLPRPATRSIPAPPQPHHASSAQRYGITALDLHPVAAAPRGRAQLRPHPAASARRGGKKVEQIPTLHLHGTFGRTCRAVPVGSSHFSSKYPVQVPGTGYEEKVLRALVGAGTGGSIRPKAPFGISSVTEISPFPGTDLRKTAKLPPFGIKVYEEKSS